MSKMFLDEFLPLYDVSEYHDILVRAAPEKIYPTFRKVNLAWSRLVKILLYIRGIPLQLTQGRSLIPSQAVTFTLNDMTKEGFMILGEEAPREIVLGSVGCFWRPIATRIKVEPAMYSDFNTPGYAKIGWNILVEKTGPNLSRVSTQTRVQCLGKGALISFLPYWLLIKPFSGLIRRKMLAEIKRMVETPEIATSGEGQQDVTNN